MNARLLVSICVNIGVVFYAPGAHAAEGSGWYGGANLGQARVRIDEQRVGNGLLASGFATTAYSADERHFGYKLFAGYQLGSYLALEGGYFDPGSFRFLTSTASSGTLRGEVDFDGVFLDAVGVLPLGRGFAAFGRIGANHGRAQSSFAGTGAVHVLGGERRKTATNITVGAGLQYRISVALAARVEAERFRVDDAVGSRGDIDLVSVGLTYRWGGLWGG